MVRNVRWVAGAVLRPAVLSAALCCMSALAASGAIVTPASAQDENLEPETGISDAAYPSAGPGSLHGVWFNKKFSTERSDNLPRELPRERHTLDGKPPPFLPWAAEEVARREQSFLDGRPFAKMSSMCLPGGVPQMMQPPPQLPLEIIETPGQVTILFESMNTFRIIRMDEDLPEDPDPTFMGTSVGHWEGDALVVETIALNDRTTIDDMIPHSEKLRVTERFRRVGPDSLEVLAIIDDPEVFSKPYAYVFSFKTVPGGKIHEFVCENNRNLPGEDGKTEVQLHGEGH